jgi:hypothetical protein
VVIAGGRWLNGIYCADMDILDVEKESGKLSKDKDSLYFMGYYSIESEGMSEYS